MPIQCPDCFANLYNESNLAKHLRSVNCVHKLDLDNLKKIYVCEDCGKKYEHKKNYIRHRGFGKCSYLDKNIDNTKNDITHKSDRFDVHDELVPDEPEHVHADTADEQGDTHCEEGVGSAEDHNTTRVQNTADFDGYGLQSFLCNYCKISHKTFKYLKQHKCALVPSESTAHHALSLPNQLGIKELQEDLCYNPPRIVLRLCLRGHWALPKHFPFIFPKTNRIPPAFYEIGCVGDLAYDNLIKAAADGEIVLPDTYDIKINNEIITLKPPETIPTNKYKTRFLTIKHTDGFLYVSLNTENKRKGPRGCGRNSCHDENTVLGKDVGGAGNEPGDDGRQGPGEGGGGGGHGCDHSSGTHEGDDDHEPEGSDGQGHGDHAGSGGGGGGGGDGGGGDGGERVVGDSGHRGQDDLSGGGCGGGGGGGGG